MRNIRRLALYGAATEALRMNEHITATQIDAINNILKDTGFKVSAVEKERFEQHSEVDAAGGEWRVLEKTNRCAILITNFKDTSGLKSVFGQD